MSFAGLLGGRICHMYSLINVVEGYVVKLSLHHGRWQTGRPVFMQVNIQQNNEADTAELADIVDAQVTITSEYLAKPFILLLEASAMGLAKLFTFPEAGTYQARVQFSHHLSVLTTVFTLHVEEGKDAADPVG